MCWKVVRMRPETLRLLSEGNLHKGDALAVARIAGIAGSKRTADLIPLAHPIGLTHAAVDVSIEPSQSGVRIETRVETVGSTGVELEALVAAAAAALTVYDMAKSHDRGMVIERVQLLMKAGGRSGVYRRKERRGETEQANGNGPNGSPASASSNANGANGAPEPAAPRPSKRRKK